MTFMYMKLQHTCTCIIEYMEIYKRLPVEALYFTVEFFDWVTCLQVLLQIIQCDCDVLTPLLQLYVGVARQSKVNVQIFYTTTIHGQTLQSQLSTLVRLKGLTKRVNIQIALHNFFFICTQFLRRNKVNVKNI